VAGHTPSFDFYTIVYSELRGGKWSKPEAMPTPINSPGNDLGYASFTSDRSGSSPT